MSSDQALRIAFTIINRLSNRVAPTPSVEEYLLLAGKAAVACEDDLAGQFIAAACEQVFRETLVRVGSQTQDLDLVWQWANFAAQALQDQARESMGLPAAVPEGERGRLDDGMPFGMEAVRQIDLICHLRAIGAQHLIV